MPRKLSEEGKDFNQLRGLGFEFETPQDEYTYQSGSGSAAGGIAGKQEYGIDTTLDSAKNRGIVESRDAIEVENPADRKLAKEIEKNSDREHLEFLKTRLGNHPDLNVEDLKLGIDTAGNLMVKGTVNTSAEMVRLKEMVEAVAGFRSYSIDVRIAKAV